MLVSEDFVQRQSWCQMNAQRGLPYKVVHNCGRTGMMLRLENFLQIEIIYLPKVHNKDQGQIPNHYDHLCIDNHRVDSEGLCPQEDCILPKHHHDSVMSAHVGAPSEEASYVLKTMRGD